MKQDTVQAAMPSMEIFIYMHMCFASIAQGRRALLRMVQKWQTDLEQTRYDCEHTTDQSWLEEGKSAYTSNMGQECKGKGLHSPAGCHSTTSSNEICEAP